MRARGGRGPGAGLRAAHLARVFSGSRGGAQASGQRSEGRGGARRDGFTLEAGRLGVQGARPAGGGGGEHAGSPLGGT